VRVVLAGSKHPIKDKVVEGVFKAVAVLVVSLLLQVQVAAAAAA